MKKHADIYLKDLGIHEGLRVRLVDGELVRKDIDENFVQYDHHPRFRFIPVDEIWIERWENLFE